MIRYVEGSIFESPADTLVNTVNTTGVMGRGLAAEFKSLYPEMFRQYRELCESGRISIGTLWIYKTEHKSVLNFPTKTDWRRPSKLEYIEAGLTTLLRGYEEAGIHNIAFPALGCGNGGLSFEQQVQPLMERYLSRMAATVYIYPHRRAAVLPEHRNIEEMRHWLRNAPEELSFPEVWSDLNAAIVRNPKLRTFGTKSVFTAEITDSPSGIRFRTESRKTVFLDIEDVLDAWKHLRSFGIVTSRSALSHKSRDMSYLGPVFALLPYIRPVRVSEGYTGNDDFARESEYGLQLLPRGRATENDSQLDLLAKA
jgi:O-acetyl-ADP-ribose deacetylase (regulator of RNase III)